MKTEDKHPSEVCGEVYDRSFFDQVVIHMHQEGSKELAEKVKGVRGKRVE